MLSLLLNISDEENNLIKKPLSKLADAFHCFFLVKTGKHKELPPSFSESEKKKISINHLEFRLITSSHQRCSLRKDLFRNFAKFTRKHLCQSLWHRCFPVNFAKYLRTLFLQNTSERVLLTLYWCFWCSITKLSKSNVT